MSESNGEMNDGSPINDLVDNCVNDIRDIIDNCVNDLLKIAKSMYQRLQIPSKENMHIKV